MVPTYVNAEPAGNNLLADPRLAQIKELDALLCGLTAAEEAAIRQITPLISIARLKHGNIGSKGNISCVFQESTLRHILPNLPADCATLLVERKGQRRGMVVNLPSYRCRRAVIGRTLELYETLHVPGWTNITISQANLLEWPEDGNLLQLPSIPRIPSNDLAMGDYDAMETDAASAAAEDALLSDEGDRGPAGLQNGVEADEVFTGVDVRTDLGNAAIGAAINAPRALLDTIQVLRRTETTANNEEQEYAEPLANFPEAAGLPDVLPAPLPPYVNLNDDETIARLPQNEALPLGDFVRMKATPYSWSRAFPTIFRPVLINGVVAIPWDITNWHTTRDRSVDAWSQWSQRIMWRSDGFAAKHPTFALVLHNDMQRRALQSQGSHAIRMDDTVDPTTTVQEWKERIESDEGRSDLHRSLNYHVANVRGTDQYFGSKLNEFKATVRYHSYVNNQEFNVFHTTSMAEYHDPFLRNLLAKYVEIVESSEAGMDVLETDSAFHKAANDYKHVVTHYFACKMETWTSSFLAPVVGLKELLGRVEFAKSRGAIHEHCVGLTESESDTALQQALQSWGSTIHTAVKHMDEYIAVAQFNVTRNEASGNNQQQSTAVSPLLLTPGSDALTAREKYLCSTDDGKQVWDDYCNNIDQAKVHATNVIVKVLEEELGVSAMHPGVAPVQWLEPAGGDGYRDDHANMLKKADVLDQKELQKYKFDREFLLHTRRVNIVNHAFLHSCSDYCWRDQKLTIRYDPTIHTAANSDVLGEPFLIKMSDGTEAEMIKFVTKDCRMGFGYRLQFGRGSCHDRTGGAERNDISSLIMDANGMPKYLMQRNHPRVVEEPILTLHWGANSDYKLFLICPSAPGATDEDRRDALHLAGYDGLDSGTGAETCLKYALGYCCKGASSSLEWDRVLDQIADGYTGPPTPGTDPAQHASMAKLVASFMRKVSGCRDIPKDEAIFLLSGGNYVSNSMPVKKCSLNTITAADMDDSEEGNKGFRFAPIVKAYKKRAVELEDCNIYIFAAHHFTGSKVVPYFFGRNMEPTWPLSEEYSQLMLMLYHPWRESTDELKDAATNTFAPRLLAYLNDPRLPRFVSTSVYQRKIKWKFSTEAGAEFEQADIESTPSDERTNPANDAAAAAACAPNEDSVLDAELDDDDFAMLANDPDYNWSQGLEPGLGTWLANYKDAFYSNLLGRQVEGIQDEFWLFDENIYCPENCRGEAQKLIVGATLLQLKDWTAYLAGNGDLPLSIHLYTQGNPGTGKSFTIRTLTNCIRKVLVGMGFDKNLAPTGCAASINRGETTIRGLSLPTGSKGHQMPQPLSTNIAQKVQAMTLQVRRLFALINDESSMTTRPELAHMRARCEELRMFIPGLEAMDLSQDGSEFLQRIHEQQQHSLPQALSTRPWGGIPLVMLFGDCQQLPPVGAKAHFSKETGKTNVCKEGRLVFKEFQEPPEGSGTIGVTVVMDEVIRQTDEQFCNVIQCMRDGTMTDETVDYCLSRRLGALPAAERKLFEKDAIYIMPTWKRTKASTVQYLKELNTPAARIDCQYQYKANRAQHAKQELKLPVKNALCKNARVMLLTNYVVEQDLKNGSVGTIIDIVYANADGPRQVGTLPVAVIVDFPTSTIPVDKAWKPEQPTLVPVPIFTQRCDKKCCSQTTIPLRICKAISINKSQGMTVGASQIWPKVVIGMPEGKSRRSPGLEQVAFSRAETRECFAVADDIPLSREMFLSIGKGKAYDDKRAFELQLRQLAPASQAPLHARILNLDESLVKTLDGGFDALVQWYRTFTN